MLLVKTYLKESAIPNAGLGCFAGEFIPAGTTIWEFDTQLDRVYTQEEFDSFNDLTKKFLSTYAYRHNGLYYLCVDDGRFFNHSDNPNTAESRSEQKTLALTDIQKDEEITSNYAFFGVTFEDYKYNVI